MSMTFGETERYIHSFFPEGKVLDFDGNKYKVVLSGKPTTREGEPKTDIYICLENETETIEVKISVKKGNADFLENKTSAERAEQILGEDWSDIIIRSTKQLEQKFTDRSLIFKKKFGRTQAGSITLGWKFELVNKLSGELSDDILLTRDQKIDVYSGGNLSDEKKHAVVNNKIVQNSGIANSVLLFDIDEYDSGEQILRQLIPIDEFVDWEPNIYFACKALNYRTFQAKYDGNRPLAVFIEWENNEGKLNPKFVFDRPLITRGNEVANNLLNVLEELNIEDTDDININNVSSMDYINI